MNQTIFYVYILEGIRNWKKVLYVWQTNDITNRMLKHKNWSSKFTKSLKNKKLLGYFITNSRKEARQLEYAIKKSKNTKKRLQHQNFIKKLKTIDT